MRLAFDNPSESSVYFELTVQHTKGPIKKFVSEEGLSNVDL